MTDRPKVYRVLVRYGKTEFLWELPPEVTAYNIIDLVKSATGATRTFFLYDLNNRQKLTGTNTLTTEKSRSNNDADFELEVAV